MNRIFIGLGSNQGDSRARLREALERLKGCVRGHLVAVSSLYQTAPVGYTQQPDFLNAVAMFRGEGAPEAWLDCCLAIEVELGRHRQGPRWGPRPVDLDLLAIEDQSLAVPRLTLPHPRLHERGFVLIPWSEVAPDFLLPEGRRIDELRAQCPHPGRVEPIEGPEWAEAMEDGKGDA